MTVTTTRSLYTSEQVTGWLRGLLTIAWADGHFDPEERDLIQTLADELAPNLTDGSSLEPITPADLATILGDDPHIGDNFLRTAVMVAVADGAYSFCEDEILYQFCQALGLNPGVLNALRIAACDPSVLTESAPAQATSGEACLPTQGDLGLHPLNPVKDWLDRMEIHDPRVARLLCRMIPPQCPFERDINLFGRKVVHIPALCKLNPLYEQLVGLRFRALCFLADECHEDVSPYC